MREKIFWLVVSRRGYSFDFVNSFQEGRDDLAKKLQESEIEVVAITTTYNFNPEPIQEVIKFVREHNKKVKTVVGGVYISQLFNTLDKETRLVAFDTIGADYYVNSYQGEETLVKLLSALKNNKPVL